MSEGAWLREVAHCATAGNRPAVPGVRGPLNVGHVLAFTLGDVRQLDAVAARFLTALARKARVLPGAYVDTTQSNASRGMPHRMFRVGLHRPQEASTH